ncbi:amino acid deaminase/aldolase, partial [Acinetobacter baumannii]
DPVIRWMQRSSGDELRERRQAIVAAVTRVAPIEFVNGGGTGSLEYTSSDAAVTELTAGSGLFAGHLFSRYRAFDPAPAAS